MVRRRFQFLPALLVSQLFTTHAGCIGVSGDVSPQGSGFLAPWPFRPPTEVIAQTAARNLLRSGLPGRLSPPVPEEAPNRRTSKAGAAKRRRPNAEVQPEPIGATTGRNHDGESNIAKCCKADTLLAGDAKRPPELL